MDRRAWQTTVHRVTKSQTRLKRLSKYPCPQFKTTFCISFSNYTVSTLSEHTAVIYYARLPLGGHSHISWTLCLCLRASSPAQSPFSTLQVRLLSQHAGRRDSVPGVDGLSDDTSSLTPRQPLTPRLLVNTQVLLLSSLCYNIQSLSSGCLMTIVFSPDTPGDPDIHKWFWGSSPKCTYVCLCTWHAYNSVGKESTCDAGDPGLLPGSGRSAGEGVGYPLQRSWASLMAQLVKNLPAMQENWVQSLGWEDPLEKGKATHSSILA